MLAAARVLTKNADVDDLNHADWSTVITSQIDVYSESTVAASFFFRRQRLSADSHLLDEPTVACAMSLLTTLVSTDISTGAHRSGTWAAA